MNSIWWCNIKLKRKNPRATSKHAFLYEECVSLVILNENKEFVHNKTNISVVNRTISRKVGDKYDYKNIDKIIPIKYLGRSLAIY